MQRPAAGLIDQDSNRQLFNEATYNQCTTCQAGALSWHRFSFSEDKMK